MAKKHLHPYTTSYTRPSKYFSPSSLSSNQLQLDDDEPLPIPSIATPLGIQKLIAIDRKKEQTDTQSKHLYHYDTPFHSSDSDRYAINKLLQSTPTIPVTTHLYTPPCYNDSPPPTTEISIPVIQPQTLLYNTSKNPMQSDLSPKQRLFKPLQHQQGVWTKERLQQLNPLYPSIPTPFSTSSQDTSTTPSNRDDPYQNPHLIIIPIKS